MINVKRIKEPTILLNNKKKWVIDYFKALKAFRLTPTRKIRRVYEE